MASGESQYKQEHTVVFKTLKAIFIFLKKYYCFSKNTPKSNTWKKGRLSFQ